MLIKYRVHELAKDLDISNKEIIDLILKYFGVAKKHMTLLTEEELNVVFEFVTQTRPVASLDAYQMKAATPIAVVGGLTAEGSPGNNKNKAFAAVKMNDAPSRAVPKKAATPAPTPKNDKKPPQDTRGQVTVEMRAVNVNLDKYNERYERMAQPAKDGFVNKQKFGRRPQRGQVRRETEQSKIRKLEMERQRRQNLKVLIQDEILVGDLALKLKVTSAEVIKKLVGLGVMAGVSQAIDFDTAATVATELGFKAEKEVVVTLEEKLLSNNEDLTGDLERRDPVVVVMGHVDHGKTSLLDKIKHTAVIETEHGGITQHIGAYSVPVGDRRIAFLDTPGHEAFTAMRARGAQVTDIAVLVVAADDGVMPQTVEAINHAKEANVSIVVAINKIDKPAADAERIKQELTEHGLIAEEWGGDTICVPVSAKNGENIETLLDMILLVADLKDLKANPRTLAKGIVIEAKLDKGKGPVATLLVQNGTLRAGDLVIAGTAIGRIRAMQDSSGKRIKQAEPSTPVGVAGLATVPSAGDVFNVVEDEKLAKELVEERKIGRKEENFNASNKVTLDNLFECIARGEMKTLNIVLKADVQGSVEALKHSLEKLSNKVVSVKIIHCAVGAVNKSDVMLAAASHAIVVGFNVRADAIATELQNKEEVDVRFYRIIYDAIDEIKSAMKGMLPPKIRDVEQGRVLVQVVYKISSIGTVAGSRVLSGKVTRNSKIRVVRDGVIVADDDIQSLKRQKDNVKEALEGFECGILLAKFNDIKEGDVLEAHVQESYIDDQFVDD
ncbi:MAG: translation initiation factor IF-2 [Oscillospiraceae bacterium]|jgi:translation initiation factor IF-2|nr:translation initiation factor IF-2 [Oscillospiraceae bacterium]